MSNLYGGVIGLSRNNQMPKSVERCVKKVNATGKSKSSAWAICQASYKKKKRSKPTK